MSELSAYARAARTSLAGALAHLQEPDTPELFTDSIQPIAKALQCLHALEGAALSQFTDAAPELLGHLRRALALLQRGGSSHQRADAAMEHVAQALGDVTTLHEKCSGSSGPLVFPLAPSSVVKPAQSAQAEAHQHVSPTTERARGDVASSSGAGVAPTTERVPPELTSQSARAPSTDRVLPVSAQQALSPHPSTQRVPRRPESSPNRSTQPASGSAHAEVPAPSSLEPLVVASLPAPPLDSAGGASPMSIDAALGANSSSNFYKGLTDNDLLRAGGVFVATYSPPVVGQRLRLRISLPGGHEVVAKGIVRWVRDPPQTASMAPLVPPGFGAQLFEVSPAGQALIDRYVRNREPMFYDDL